MARVKITTFVPETHADAVRDVLGKAGAGQLGEYTYCSFTTRGTGRFTPSSSAKPFIGTPGQLEAVEEERVEVVCDRDKAKAVIAAMKTAHPYEEVAFDIVPLLEESEL
jgi:hypothetical protein